MMDTYGISTVITMPSKASDEAMICMTCPYKKCNPTSCKRYKEEMKKLKEAKAKENKQ